MTQTSKHISDIYVLHVLKIPLYGKGIAIKLKYKIVPKLVCICLYNKVYDVFGPFCFECVERSSWPAYAKIY